MKTKKAGSPLPFLVARLTYRVLLVVVSVVLPVPVGPVVPVGAPLWAPAPVPAPVLVLLAAVLSALRRALRLAFFLAFLALVAVVPSARLLAGAPSVVSVVDEVAGVRPTGGDAGVAAVPGVTAELGLVAPAGVAEDAPDEVMPELVVPMAPAELPVDAEPEGVALWLMDLLVPVAVSLVPGAVEPAVRLGMEPDGVAVELDWA